MGSEVLAVAAVVVLVVLVAVVVVAASGEQAEVTVDPLQEADS